MDELHDVVVQPVLLADAEDRHDVGVVQPCSGPRLTLEAGQLAGVEQGVVGQDLQGHVPAERLLLGLVDDAHAAPAYFAEDAEVAQSLQPPARGACLGRSGICPGLITAVGLDLLDQHQRGEQVADGVSVLGELVGVLGDGRDARRGGGELRTPRPGDRPCLDPTSSTSSWLAPSEWDWRGSPMLPGQLSSRPGMLARVSLSRLSARR